MTTPLDLSQDAATPWRVVYSGLQFPGEVVVGGDWRDRYGEALPAGLSFRVAFLRSHAALHPPALSKGVVVAMPSPRPSPEAQQATRQLGALREVQAGYLTSTSSELRALGRSLAREEQKAAARLHTDLARAYASGAIVASTAVRGDAGAVFGLPGPTAWADSLAGAVLGVVHPQTPIAPSLLTRPVTPADVRPLLSVVSGSSDASSGGDAAMLLPGLRLRRQDLEHSPVLEFVQAAIKRGGKLGVVALLDELSQSLGLPRYLAPVFIVAYIARNRPASELDLMDSHEITHRSGAPFLGDRLSWDVLSDIAWPEDLERRVVALGPAQPPTSRSPLPYGVELVPNLRSMPAPLNEQEQAAIIAQALHTLRRQVGETQAGLAMLHTAFGAPLSLPAFGPPHTLERVVGSRDLPEFHNACARAGLTLVGLRAALDAFRRLRPLASAAQEILEARAYLSSVAPTLADPDTGRACLLLLARLDLPSLEADPSALTAIRQAHQQFKERYARAYRAHHGQYHTVAARLNRQLDNAAPLLDALAKFNTVGELGPPVAPDLVGRFRAFSATLQTCSEKAEALPLADVPFCRACGLRLDQAAPEREVELLLGELENAWREQNRRLAVLAAHHVLAQTQASSVDKLARLVQTADLTPLANVLDTEVMDFLRSFVAEFPPVRPP